MGREDDGSLPGQADGALAFGDGVMLIVVSLAVLCSVGLLASGY